MPKTRRSSRASKRTVDEYEESQKPEKNVQRDAEEQDFQLNANHLDHEADSDATDDETIEREVQEGDDALIKELNELQGIGQEGDSDASSNDELLRELKEQDDETESDDEADDEDDNNTNRQSARKAPNRRKKAVKSDAAPHQDDEDEKPAKQISTKSKADAEPAPVEILTSDSDTTDDEHSTNRVGRIPMEWYHDYEHIGYGLDGKRIRKPKQKDRLQKFLDKMEGKDYSRTVYDPVTGQEIQLTDEDIEMIKRIQGGQLPDAGIDPYEDYVDFFTHEKMKTPVVSVPEPKRRFVPSKWEHKKIMKIVRSIRKGWIKLDKPKQEEDTVYDIWAEEDSKQLALRRSLHISAPKTTLPTHAESYNPPAEYLPTPEESETWKKAHEEDRERNFLPNKYSCLRLVPGYERFVQERFQRCLDLYLCPRAQRVRMNVDPNSLLPKLPKPQDLQPFPTAASVIYRGHTASVTSLSPDPTGQWLVTGSDDKTVRVWEVATGRCVKVVPVEAEVNMVAWCPNASVGLIAVAAGLSVTLFNPQVASTSILAHTDQVCASSGAETDADAKSTIDWTRPSDDDYNKHGIRFVLKHKAEVRQVTWHRKGNYFAAVMPQAPSHAVCVHSLNRQTTQYPFRKKNHDVQRVLFHPAQPLFFVATKTHIRVYNLQAQSLVKKLITGVRWISSMDIHPAGDNLIVGSYDRRLCWFDLDLSIKPYKTLRYHTFALRQVAFHSSYPLFASCGDDGSVHVLHGMVYNDLSQNPLIVPVKIIKAHKQSSSGLGVMDCKYHPSQPWIFSAGADGTACLLT
eukprot:TRINITY_DN6067_c0_g1_i2.p1 TRINITY_DN6067_c0_g1~~TRINITY_DN6067_c0_g1_i2.p1  ORF type:complete len:798 (+),score=185.90 TRINITY_DN6067_c0_g1_i2:19-2412(+)